MYIRWKRCALRRTADVTLKAFLVHSVSGSRAGRGSGFWAIWGRSACAISRPRHIASASGTRWHSACPPSGWTRAPRRPWKRAWPGWSPA